MEHLAFSMADLTINIKLPIHMDISAESVPFLVPYSSDCNEVVEVIPVHELPFQNVGGTWHQDRYFIDTPHGETFYIRAYPNSPPYAMVEYKTDNQILIYYLVKSKEMVFQSRYLINMLGLEQLLLRHSAVILHASFICYQSQGILFAGRSGIGKSTQADLWVKYKKAKLLNGDRAGLRRKSEKWVAYGLPFAGSSHIYNCESAPVKAIVVLDQGIENTLQRMTPIDALRTLLPEFSTHIWNSSFMEKILDITAVMLKEVPVYKLVCRPDYGAVCLLNNVLFDEEKK